MLKISIRLTEAQKTQIQSLSQIKGISVSEWIRETIEHQLAKPQTQMSDLAIAEAKALFETRFLTRLMLNQLTANPAETNELIAQAKLAAEELFQKKLAVTEN